MTATMAQIWMNGQLVPYDNAVVHVGTTALHFGPVAFEGIRCYELQDGTLNLFRLRRHVERLFASTRALHLEIPFSPEEIERACADTVVANGHREAYVRPIAFAGGEGLGFGRDGTPTTVCVLSFPWDQRHLTRSQRRGITAHIASAIRTEAHPVMSKSKISANYAAGLLAIREARRSGFDEALLLDGAGSVAEASTANVFAVAGGRLITPPSHLPILPGITREALLTLALELGVEAVERTFSSEELASFDELFIAGTTVEVTPVLQVDGRPIGNGRVGEVTLALLSALGACTKNAGSERGWGYFFKS